MNILGASEWRCFNNMSCDIALGNLVRFVLLPGQRHDLVGAPPLIKDIQFEAVLADKAFDVEWLRAERDERGAVAVIPPRRHRQQPIDYDKVMDKWRHLIDNYFVKIKEFRGIATRYDKTDTRFAANLTLAAATIATRELSTGLSITVARPA